MARRGLSGVDRRPVRDVTENRGTAIGHEKCGHSEQPCRSSALALVTTGLGHECGESGAH